MNNVVMHENFNYTSRAMLTGAMLGGVASIAKQWKASQQRTITPNEYIKKVVTDTLKAGAVSAATAYTANKMVDKPVISMATILTVGVAGAYLLSSDTKGNTHE